MTYHEREALVSQTSPHQQSSSPRRAGNSKLQQWYPSQFSSPPSVHIECNAEERQLSTASSSPTHIAMTEPIKPVQFRSQIILHNNPDTNMFIERLRVAFYRPDELPDDVPPRPHRSSPPSRSQSLHTPRSSPSRHRRARAPHDKRRPDRMAPSPGSQALLHQWIDDICANQQLMSNDDIVFFIKNGEFFARI